MARTALRGRLTWQLAELVEAVAERPRVKTIIFDVPGWPGHRATQHVDVRLTAGDGYQAERSYSIASAPDGTRIALTVQRLDDGEVSLYLTDGVPSGDKIELRGPIGQLLRLGAFRGRTELSAESLQLTLQRPMQVPRPTAGGSRKQPRLFGTGGYGRPSTILAPSLDQRIVGREHAAPSAGRLRRDSAGLPAEPTAAHLWRYRSRIESCRSLSLPSRLIAGEAARFGTDPGGVNRWDGSPVLLVGGMPHLWEVEGL